MSFAHQVGNLCGQIVRSTRPVALFACFALVSGILQANCIEDSPNLPPPDSSYSADIDHVIYQVGPYTIDLTELVHFGFTNIAYTPFAGGTQENFDSRAKGVASINGSPSIPFELTGPVSVNLYDGYSPGSTGTFHTEMVGLSFSGAIAGNSVMIRESPTLVSTGQTSIKDLGNGQYRISSFFDIFTELSLDGGATWVPGDQATHVTMHCPEPGSLGLMSLGGLGVALSSMCRRRKVAK